MANGATSESDPNEVATSEQLLEEAEALNEYWTPEALAEATPIETIIEDEEGPEALFEQDFTPEGAEETARPEPADGEAVAAWDPQPRCPSSGPNTERVPDRRVIPYSPVGKMFMAFDGKNYVGSAWVVANIGAVTAGHCVFEKSLGGWADKVLFIPQYHKGNEPLGRWAASQLVALNGWTNDRDFKFDIGGFKVDRAIKPRTGSLGWLANAAPNQGCITGIGFPAGAPFDGKEMWRSTGKNLGGSNPIKMANNMTGGCSGGPWEVWRNGTPLTNGLNSFRYRNDPNSMYSPYFGKGFLNVYNWLK